MRNRSLHVHDRSVMNETDFREMHGDNPGK
jgi:hypothetical protein